MVDIKVVDGVGTGSFIEVVKLLELLTKGSKDAPFFHIIAPLFAEF